MYAQDIFFTLQEDKDFDEVRDEESSDEEEGVEADTTMTLQGGVRQFSFSSWFEYLFLQCTSMFCLW